MSLFVTLKSGSTADSSCFRCFQKSSKSFCRVNAVWIFSGDKELFRITADNVGDYADKLSPGQVELLKRYPQSYYYPVFESRRISTYPPEVLERAKAQAATVDMVPGGNGLLNLNASNIPFPFPKQALEIVWNHINRYRGGSVFPVPPVFQRG